MSQQHARTASMVRALYAVAFLDLLAVSLLLPLLSKHLRAVGASATVAGLVSSVYGGLQLFSSPTVGRWSDASGRRHVLLCTILLATCGYLLLGFADTVFLVLLARIPSGIFKHTQELCRGYLASKIPKSEHSAVFGKFNSCGSIGFIVGPVIGGHIAVLENGFHYNAFLCSAICVTNALIIFFMLPSNEEMSAQREMNSAMERKPGFVESFRLVNWDNLWDIFLMRFFFGFAMFVYRSNFSMMLDYKYNVSPKTIGYIISFSGVIGTFSGFFVGRISRLYCDDVRLLRHTSLAQTASILLITWAPSLPLLLVFMAPLSVANAIARVASTNVTLARGRGQETGVLLGLGGSVLSVARMISPAIGGLAQELHVAGPGLVGAAFAALGTLVVVLVPQQGRGQEPEIMTKVVENEGKKDR